ncbi:hypothetical protein, partial [Klebsiella pneumoniae]
MWFWVVAYIYPASGKSVPNNRGSITFWLDDEAIQAWYESA